ncbi:MAG: hypothetical protein QOD75_2991 [Blastocatellia bacterium]|jgi:hypothetical protein|nr:hypothetical protein [Blastocatellia bacterium]
MEGKKYSGGELARALQQELLQRPSPDIIGIVKKSDREDHVALSLNGCRHWLHIPTNMIMDAEQIGFSRCGDHGHPLMKLSMEEPKSSEARVFLALLGQLQPRLTGPGSFAAQSFGDCYKGWRDKGFSRLTSVINCL